MTTALIPSTHRPAVHSWTLLISANCFVVLRGCKQSKVNHRSGKKHSSHRLVGLQGFSLWEIKEEKIRGWISGPEFFNVLAFFLLFIVQYKKEHWEVDRRKTIIYYVKSFWAAALCSLFCERSDWKKLEAFPRNLLSFHPAPPDVFHTKVHGEHSALLVPSLVTSRVKSLRFTLCGITYIHTVCNTWPINTYRTK